MCDVRTTPQRIGLVSIIIIELSIVVKLLESVFNTYVFRLFALLYECAKRALARTLHACMTHDDDAHACVCARARKCDLGLKCQTKLKNYAKKKPVFYVLRQLVLTFTRKIAKTLSN